MLFVDWRRSTFNPIGTDAVGLVNRSEHLTAVATSVVQAAQHSFEGILRLQDAGGYLVSSLLTRKRKFGEPVLHLGKALEGRWPCFGVGQLDQVLVVGQRDELNHVVDLDAPDQLARGDSSHD